MFTQIRRVTAAQDCALQIREKILAGQLSPGEKLPRENELADMFGVNRSTVREAMRALEQAGIITVSKGPRGGVFVAKPDEKVVTDSLGAMLKLERVPLGELIETRADLESAVVRLAVQRATEEDLDEMRAAVEEMRADTPCLSALRRHNRRFHFALAAAGRNRVWLMLANVVRDLMERSIDLRDLDEAAWLRIVENHKRIVSAIEARDGDAAEEAVRVDHGFLAKDFASGASIGP